MLHKSNSLLTFIKHFTEIPNINEYLEKSKVILFCYFSIEKL